MNKTARNKPAVLKISRSATRIGSLQTQGPFPRAKKPLSARTLTSQSILESQGHLRKASKPESSNRTSTTPVPVKIQGPFKKNKPLSSNQAPASPKPVQTPGRKTSVPASSDRPSTGLDRPRTLEPLPKTSAIQTRVPVPKTKIPVSSGYGNQGSAARKPGPLQTQGPAFSDQNSISPGVQPMDDKPVYSDQASSSSIPLQTSKRKDSKSESFVSGSQEQLLPKGNEPAYPDQDTTSPCRIKTTKPKDGDSESSDETITSPSPVQTKEVRAIETESAQQFITRPSLVQNPGPVSQGDEPAFSDQGRPKSVPISSERLSTSPGLLQTRAPVPKTRIPVLSDSRNRGSNSTNTGPVQPPVLNKPKVTGRAFGSTFSLQTQEVKAFKPKPSTRTPTSPEILQNRTRTKASGSVTSVRNRGSVSISPSYTRRPKTSIPLPTNPSYTRRPKTSIPVYTSPSYIRRPVNPDRASAGPKGRKPVSSVSKSAFRSLGSIQTKGALPKCKKPTSPVSKIRGKAFNVSSKRSPASSVSAKTPGLNLANNNQDLAFKRAGILGTNKSRIPTSEVKCIDQASGIHDGMKKLYTKPEFRSKQCSKSMRSRSPDRLQTKLADELDRSNLSINELQMKLVQNQSLVSEQELRLAESKAIQRAKDVAFEQLKSELWTVKNEYDRMHLRLREADLGLEQATCKVKKYLERSTSMEDELKEARDKIINLQRQLKDADAKAEIHCQSKDQLRQDVERMQEQLALDSKRIQNLQQSENDLRGDLENRDRLITQVNHELATRDEEFRNLFETLKNKHTQLRSQELSVKRLEERYERRSLNISKLEDRNAALLVTIEQLKNDLRYYSQMIIANDGKPFFEKVPPGIDPNIADGLVPSPEKESQPKRKPKRREK